MQIAKLFTKDSMAVDSVDKQLNDYLKLHSDVIVKHIDYQRSDHGVLEALFVVLEDRQAVLK